MKIPIESLVEVILKDRDDFLKVMETLTRIGIASRKDNVLWQSCHILHKRGKYYIVHFKELFALDGKPTDISESDIGRRNTISLLLEEWGLLSIVNSDQVKSPLTPLSQIKVLQYDERNEWNRIQKYSIGTKKS